MKKWDLVRSTVAVTAMMIMASVGYTASGSPLGDLGVVQEVQAAEIDTENPNQEDINDIVSKVVSNSAIESEPEPTPDIKFVKHGQLFVYQGDVLTEEVLKLPSNLHLNSIPYVCEEVGSYTISVIVVNDDNECGRIDYRLTVYERPITPVPTSSTAPTPTSVPTPTVTPTTAPSPVPTSSATGNNGVLVSSDIDDYSQSSSGDSAIEASTFTRGVKTVTVACGSVLRFDDLGFNDIHLLDTNGNSCSYSYDYDESLFDKKYSKVQTFSTVVTQTNDTTGEVVKYTVTVNVKDMTKPTLKGVKKVIKIVGGKDVVARIKKGVSATDNVDGKIAKSRIKVSGYKAKKYDKVQKVTFTVKDKAGNITKKTVKLKITNPVKKLSKYMYTKSVVNVRKTSSAKGKKLGTLKFGTKVKVIGQDRNTGWYKIKYKGGTGWVNSSYLSSKKLSKPVKKQNPSASDSKNTTPGSNLNADASNCACNCDCSDCINLDTIVCASACDCVGSTNGGW